MLSYRKPAHPQIRPVGSPRHWYPTLPDDHLAATERRHRSSDGRRFPRLLADNSDEDIGPRLAGDEVIELLVGERDAAIDGESRPAAVSRVRDPYS